MVSFFKKMDFRFNNGDLVRHKSNQNVLWVVKHQNDCFTVPHYSITRVSDSGREKTLHQVGEYELDCEDG